MNNQMFVILELTNFHRQKEGANQGAYSFTLNCFTHYNNQNQALIQINVITSSSDSLTFNFLVF